MNIFITYIRAFEKSYSENFSEQYINMLEEHYNDAPNLAKKAADEFAKSVARVDAEEATKAILV